MIDDNPEVVEACKGDKDAVALFWMVVHICNVWDNLIDKDKPEELTDTAIHNAFLYAMIGVNRNPFFRRHVDELVPVLDVVAISWIGSNSLAKGSDQSKVIAHVIRYNVTQFLLKIMQIIGGYQWAIERSDWAWTMCCRDTLENFMLEHKDA